MRRAAASLALTFIALATVAAPHLHAQRSTADSVLDARTTEIASQLRCPVCQGLSIQDSPSDLSEQMRAVVRDQLKAGKTPEEVKAYFVSKYGEWILLEPKPHGFNILVYALPISLVVVGLAVIAFSVRRWTTPSGT